MNHIDRIRELFRVSTELTARLMELQHRIDAQLKGMECDFESPDRQDSPADNFHPNMPASIRP